MSNTLYNHPERTWRFFFFPGTKPLANPFRSLPLSLFLDKKVDLLLPLFFPSPFPPNLILSFQTRLCRKFTFFLLLPPPFLLLLLQWLHLLQCCTTTSAAAAAARSRLFAKEWPRRAARGKSGGGAISRDFFLKGKRPFPRLLLSPAKTCGVVTGGILMALPRGIIQFIWDECCQPPSPHPPPLRSLSIQVTFKTSFSELACGNPSNGGRRVEEAEGNSEFFRKLPFPRGTENPSFFPPLFRRLLGTCIKVHAFAVHHILYHASSNCWSKKGTLSLVSS